jgi:hypothetical protein
MPAHLISIPIPPPLGFDSRFGFVSGRLGIPSPRGLEFILSFIVWVLLPSPLISVPPGRSLALRVPFAGLAYHRLSRCWLARRPSDLVDLHSYSSTPEVIFPIGCPAQLISIPMPRPQGFDSRFGFVRDRVGYRACCSWPADYAVPIPVFVRPSLVVVVLF